MKRLQRIAFVALVAMAFMLGQSGAWGQIPLTPYGSSEGVGPSREIAKDSIGSDARLFWINAVSGTDPETGIEAGFDLATGKSEIWAYTYFSPTTDKGVAVGMVQVPFLGFRGTGSVADSFGLTDDVQELSLTGPYAPSEQMVTRLQSNPEFQSYRTTYPDRNPASVALGMVHGEEIGLPEEFDIEQPIWSLLFADSVASGQMICYVGANDGNVSCYRGQILSSVASGKGVEGTASLNVAPNPANGRTRVTVDLPQGFTYGSDARLCLYNERGQQVLDLTESFVRNGRSFVEFDAQELPSGVYYCRATGSNWQGVIGVVVGK